MMNLGNLKVGQTKVAGELTVVKTGTQYQVTWAGLPGENAILWFEKDAKAWFFTVVTPDAQTFRLDGQTAKTVLEAAFTRWQEALTEAGRALADEPETAEEPEAEAAPEPAAEPEPVATTDAKTRQRKLDQIAAAIKLAQDERGDQEQSEAALAMAAKLMAKYSITEEEVRRLAAKDAGQEAKPEKIQTWTYAVNVQGGHALHRVAAFFSVVRAMGADGFYTHDKVKGAGYKNDTVTLYVVAQTSVVESLKVFLPLMELQMERLGDLVSKETSRKARLAGGHHSGPGCHARRGFMRGFGDGIATRIVSDTKQMAKEDESGSTALVVQDRATQVAAYMALKHPNLKSHAAQKFDSAAYREGHAAGVAFASPKIAQPEREAINA